MKRIFEIIAGWIIVMVDFFYPPFRKYMTLQLFRYAVIGATNVVISQIIFFIVYNYILNQNELALGFYALKPHTASLIISFPFANLIGFLLQKYVTFPESELRGRIQLFRYFSITIINLIINAIVLKILVEVFHFWTTPSNMVATCVCILISYFSSKIYIFRKSKLKLD